jgi:hypothetical protein
LKTRWTVKIEEDPFTGDLMLPLPPELIRLKGWQPGDLLVWIDNGNGTWSIEKKTVQMDTRNNPIE